MHSCVRVCTCVCVRVRVCTQMCLPFGAAFFEGARHFSLACVCALERWFTCVRFGARTLVRAWAVEHMCVYVGYKYPPFFFWCYSGIARFEACAVGILCIPCTGMHMFVLTGSLMHGIAGEHAHVCVSTAYSRHMSFVSCTLFVRYFTCVHMFVLRQGFLRKHVPLSLYRSHSCHTHGETLISAVQSLLLRLPNRGFPRHLFEAHVSPFGLS